MEQIWQVQLVYFSVWVRLFVLYEKQFLFYLKTYCIMNRCKIAWARKMERYLLALQLECYFQRTFKLINFSSNSQFPSLFHRIWNKCIPFCPKLTIAPTIWENCNESVCSLINADKLRGGTSYKGNKWLIHLLLWWARKILFAVSGLEIWQKWLFCYHVVSVDNKRR